MRHSDTVAAMLRELGQQLAALRREAGLTQENLGALAGFSRTTVSVAEKAASRMPGVLGGLRGALARGSVVSGLGICGFPVLGAAELAA